ncbi:MAG: OmpH family outer membrane protein [Bacteroidales bacterium]|nr:OmpH family outer membrane protein [Bacteroidales bacterium]MBN2698193.1 OmpH family outer membrane protein [Bacteroidales bacterium]
MKRINLIVNAVLAAAVIVLFILYFTGNKKSSDTATTKAEQTITSPLEGALQIAYINMDSIMANWTLYRDYQQELGNKQQQLESDFAGRTETFYKSVEDAQYKMERGLVTRAEAQQLQQQLQTEEQKLLNLQNEYTMQLQEEGMVKNRRLLDALERYLKDYSQEHGYHYIFSYQFGGNLLYGEKVLDITGEVVLGLNKTFRSDEDL